MRLTLCMTLICGVLIVPAACSAKESVDTRALTAALEAVAIPGDLVSMDWIKQEYPDWIVFYDAKYNIYRVSVLPQKDESEETQQVFRNLAYLIKIFSSSKHLFEGLKKELMDPKSFALFSKEAGATKAKVRIKGKPTRSKRREADVARKPREFTFTSFNDPEGQKLLRGALSMAKRGGVNFIPSDSLTLSPLVISITYADGADATRAFSQEAPKNLAGFLYEALEKIEHKKADSCVDCVRNALLAIQCSNLAPLIELYKTDPITIGIQLDLGDHAVALVIQKQLGKITCILADSRPVTTKSEGLSGSLREAIEGIKQLVENENLLKDALIRGAYARAREKYAHDELRLYKSVSMFFSFLEKHNLFNHPLFKDVYKEKLCQHIAQLLGKLNLDRRIHASMRRQYKVALQGMQNVCLGTVAPKGNEHAAQGVPTKKIDREAMIRQIEQVRNYKTLFKAWGELDKYQLLTHPLFQSTYRSMLLTKARDYLGKLRYVPGLTRDERREYTVVLKAIIAACEKQA